MFILVIGGAASGKSAYAEELILRCGEKKRTYIATMEPFDAECEARIAKHRILRQEKQFTTIECYTDLASVTLAEKGAVLLECMSNLAANERYSPKGAGEAALTAILTGVDALLSQCEDLVVVSNDVFGGGTQYAGDTLAYLKLLAEINRALAAKADAVCEVVSGVPVYYKGGEWK